MIRQIVLALCVLAFAALAVNAQPVSDNCFFRTLGVYATPGDFPLSPLLTWDTDVSNYQSEFNISTNFPFAASKIYLNITLYNGLNTTFIYRTNGGAYSTLNYPHDVQQDANLISIGDLIPRTSCSQFNWVDFNISQAFYGGPRTSSCTYEYKLWITSTEGGVCGDPQFVGLRGQRFQIHGIDGAVYNLISTSSYAINSQFRFLSGPRPCPIMPTTGKKSLACWSHDGSYLENVAFITTQGEKFTAQSGSAESGLSSVTFNNRQLTVGDYVTFSEGSIAVNSTHEITLNIGAFNIEIENVDGFVNLRRVRVAAEDMKVLAAGEGTHGLLGQTWQNKRYSGRIPEIQGTPDDYVIVNEDIFGTEFTFSRMSIQ